MGSDREAEKTWQKEKERKKMLTIAPTAKPLAGKKLSKRLCVIAGNISPIVVLTHVPILCEEADIPYAYVRSKEYI